MPGIQPIYLIDRIEPELNNPVGMKKVQRWEREHVTASEPALLVGPKLHEKLGLKMVPAGGWFIYPDGAMRANQGSMSELRGVPHDLEHKWMVIAEYRCVALHLSQGRFARLKQELMQRVKSAEKSGGGGEPDAEEIAQLKQIGAEVKALHSRFQKAKRMVRKYHKEDLEAKQLEDLADENMEYVANARAAIEDIKVPGDLDYQPDEEEREEFGKRDPSKMFEGFDPNFDLDDPRLFSDKRGSQLNYEIDPRC